MVQDHEEWDMTFIVPLYCTSNPDKAEITFGISDNIKKWLLQRPFFGRPIGENIVLLCCTHADKHALDDWNFEIEEGARS